MLWATVALIMAYIITAVIETSKPLKSVNEVLDAAGFNGTRRARVSYFRRKYYTTYTRNTHIANLPPCCRQNRSLLL